VRGAADIAALPREEQNAALPVPQPPTPREPRDARARNGTGEHVKADILAFLEASENRNTRAIDKEERVELARRFIAMLHVGDVFRADRPASEPRPRAAPRPKPPEPTRTIPQVLPSQGYLTKEQRRQLGEKPKAADDEVAAFLANGGKIERCPTAAVTWTPGIKLSEADIAALAQHKEDQRARFAEKREAGRQSSDAA
jgi:hypothetical protein